MTKQEALDLVGCSVTELAKKLGISHNAISQWDEKKIPVAREYQIRDLSKGKKPILRINQNQSVA